MAVEPQMQRRWEQLAGYVASSFRVVSLNNVASESVQFVNKLVAAATLYLGAKLVIGGTLSVGELVAFNMLSTRVSSPVLRLAQIWQDFHQARLSVERLGDVLNTMPEPTLSPVRAALRRSAAASRSIMSRSATGRMAPRPCTTSASTSSPARWSASSARPARARARSPSWSSGFGS
jgi:ABC-type multidrug transport system fused ATPase/permease subunit